MCGICGKVNLGGLTAANLKAFTALMVRSQIRGTDASGAFNSDGYAVKAPGSFERSLKPHKEYKKFLKASLGLSFIVGHTRAATQGSPAKNRNNHPFSVDTGAGRLTLVHNGWVESPSVEETDTWEVVRDLAARIEAGGKIADFLGDFMFDIKGEAVLAILHKGDLFLAKNGINSLVFAKTGEFASTAAILGKAAAYSLKHGEAVHVSGKTGVFEIISIHDCKSARVWKDRTWFPVYPEPEPDGFGIWENDRTSEPLYYICPECGRFSLPEEFDPDLNTCYKCFLDAEGI